MNLNNKLYLIKKDWMNIFSVKSGKVIEIKNVCYQIPKHIALFFDIYYGGIIIFSIFLLWIIVDEYIIHNFYISIGLTIFLYLILEVIFYFMIPIREIKCWNTYSIGKKK